jgi:hypothetical protein
MSPTTKLLGEILGTEALWRVTRALLRVTADDHRGPIQSLPHSGEITPAITSEPPTPDQHVDFSLAQLDRDASQPLPSAIAMPWRRASRSG